MLHVASLHRIYGLTVHDVTIYARERLDIRSSSFKVRNAFTLEANQVPARVGRSSPGNQINPVMLSKGLLSPCSDGRGVA
jgi:hypothetical protein